MERRKIVLRMLLVCAMFVLFLSVLLSVLRGTSDAGPDTIAEIQADQLESPAEPASDEAIAEAQADLPEREQTSRMHNEAITEYDTQLSPPQSEFLTIELSGYELTADDLFRERHTYLIDADYAIPLLEFESMRFDVFLTDAPHGYIAINHVRTISRYVPYRIPFTQREYCAARLIVYMLLAKGFDAEQIEVQYFNIDDPENEYILNPAADSTAIMETRGWLPNQTLREHSQNIILTIPGQSEKKIVIGAHYDSLPYAGASDNASGVALLLESAQRMMYTDNYYTLVYVFFGAEEIGLIGAFYFYNSLTEDEQDNILLMINADSLFEGPHPIFGVGYYEERFFGVLGYTGMPESNEVSLRIEELASKLNRDRDLGLWNAPEVIGLATDHLAFLFNGHTVMYFIGIEIASYILVANGDSYSYAPRKRHLHGAGPFPFLHSERDTYDFISNERPGLMEDNLYSFGVFLEEVLLMLVYRQ